MKARYQENYLNPPDPFLDMRNICCSNYSVFFHYYCIC